MVDVDVQVARTTAAADAAPPRPQARYTAELRRGTTAPTASTGGTTPGGCGGRGSRRSGSTRSAASSAAFRRRHGLKADARVYLAFASPGRGGGVRPARPRGGQRAFLSLPVTVRSTSPSRTRE